MPVKRTRRGLPGGTRGLYELARTSSDGGTRVHSGFFNSLLGRLGICTAEEIRTDIETFDLTIRATSDLLSLGKG